MSQQHKAMCTIGNITNSTFWSIFIARTLEHLNIVQLGNKLGSKITREYYPKNLIKKTGLTLEEIPCSFVENNEFYNNISDTICLFNFPNYSVNGLFIDDNDKIKFSLLEKKLEAISQKLKLIHNNNRHFYNADGIISNIESEIKIAILETTGPLLHQNNPKETQDYIRAGYGLVAILHVIRRKFHYGDFEIFKKIGSFFCFSATKIRIWRAFMLASKVYVTNCIGLVEVQQNLKRQRKK
ncbi:MAG: hypothetical protein EXX96DRAFT_594635 [Benjaminiella poitrasii]|nr:MAG: hypothetical protein EXX96DRAFT_594635 [Benjaminiella poitrasii]